ncbi:MAG: cation:proton antiporter [Thermodesulfobacteriota bacterium]
MGSLSELGLAFLLFMIGLEIELKKLKEAGKVVLSVGFVQVVICAFAGYAAAHVIGFDGFTACT